MPTDWNEIVRIHGPAVFGIAWRVLGQSADAEDVVQEVFLEAHRLERSAEVDEWAGLLRRMGTFRALDRLRQRRTSLSLNGLSVAGNTHEPEADAIAGELEERLRQAVSQLPEREAAVFCLRYFEELSYREISEALAVSSGAVATALHKARTKLKELLEDDERGNHDAC